MSEMSESKGSPDPNPRATGQLITALLILLGVIGLLPGVCSVLFMGTGGPNPIAGLGLIISGGGVLMIGMGIGRMIRRRRAAADEQQADERGCRNALLILLGLIVSIAAVIGILIAR
jgi:hypothetical protein